MSLTKLPGFTLDTSSNVTFANANVSGNLTAGNANLGNLVTANFFVGNGSLLTGITITGAYSNTNTAAYLPTYTGNISANYFIGNGSLLTNINGANITGNAPFAGTAHYANTANAVSGTNVSGNVASGVQSHFANIANSVTFANVSGTPTTISGYGITDYYSNTNTAAYLTANPPTGTYSNTNTAAYLPTYTGNFTAGNINLSYATTSTANLGNSVRANYVVGNGYYLTGVDLLTAGNADIANSIANGTSNINTPTANGNITVSIGGTANTVVFANSGNYIVTTGNVKASHYFGDGSQLTGITGTYSNTNTAAYLTANPPTGTYSNTNTAAYLTANPPTGTYSNTNTAAYLPTYTGNLTAGNINLSYATTSTANLGNAVRANYFVGNGAFLTGVDLLSVGNADIANSIANGTSNINTPTSNGNITVTIGGTANTAIFTTSGITANTFTGNLFLSVSGTTNAAIVSANMAGSDYFRILVGGTSTDGGFVEFATADNGNEPIYFRQYNVSGAVGFGTVARTLTLLDASGDTYVPGKLTTTGNIIANAGSFFLGNGYYLTGVDQLSVGNADIANSIANGTSNINTPTAGGNITVGIGGTANTVIFANTGVSVAGTLNVTGNAFVGNLTVTGTTTTVNSTTTRVVDPIFELGGGANGAALSTDDNKDRGLLLHYYSGSSTVDAFMGWDDSNGEFGFGSNVSVSSEVITWNSYANVRGNYFIGDGSLLTGVDVLTVGSAGFADIANSIANGTSNVNTPYLNGPITVGIGGAANAVVFTSTGINVAGYSNIGGTVTAGTGTGGSITGANAITSNYFIGDGSLLTGISGTYSNTNTAAYLTANPPTGTYSNTNTAAYLTANPPTGTYSNTNTAAYLPTYTGNLTAGNINLSHTTTSTANLGNAVVGNYFIGDGSLLTGITASYSNTNTAAYLTANPPTGTYSNTNTAAYLATATFTTTGNITANVITATTLTVGNGTITSNGNISFTGANVSLGSVSNLNITGGAANYYLKTDGAGALSWSAVTGGGGGGGVTLTSATSPPVSGNLLGDQWYNTSSDVLYEYINDGVAAYWVDVSSPSTSSNSSLVGAIAIKDEGSNLTNAVSSINFTGSGITASNTGNAVTVTVNSATLLVQNAGSNLTSTANTLNFTGSGVTATNSSNVVTVTVAGGITAQDLLSPFLLMGA